MIVHGCWLYLFISFYILKVFQSGHLLLLDTVKYDIKNSSKSKCLCQSYKPKIWVCSEEADYSCIANSQRVTEEL